jgi:hypothetical protein
MTDTIFSLVKYGRRLGTRAEGERVQQDLLAALEKLHEGELLVVDLSGLDVLAGSFSDQVLVETAARLSEGALPERYLVLRSPSETLVEDLDVRLRERKLALLVLLDERDWRLLGFLPRYLAEAFDWIVEHGETTSEELAEALSISAGSASTRFSMLVRLRLVHVLRESRDAGGFRHRVASIASIKKIS